MKNSFINDFELERFKNEILVIAVSTGIDSMCLFHYLYNHGYKVVVAHVNHKRRIESDNEYEYLYNLCKKLNVPFEGYTITETIDGNFQEQARLIRYNFFMEVADKYNTKNIVLAHQADDMVETILMRLTRGTSIKGYSGIKKYSESNGYNIIRPLLETPRSKIVEYQKENNIKYFEDSSNSLDHYTRNIFRHKIVSELKEINPNLYESFNYFKKDIEGMSEIIDDMSKAFIREKAIINKGSVSILKDDFNSLKDIVKREVILNIVNIISNNTVEITHEKTDEILNLALKNNEAREIEIKDEYLCANEFNNITFYKREKQIEFSILVDSFKEFTIENIGKVIISQKHHLLPSKISYMLCYNSLSEVFPITIRNYSNGDKITYNHITKKVSDLLKEHKVPLRLRNKTVIFKNKDGIFFIPECIRKETDTSKPNKLYITFLKDER